MKAALEIPEDLLKRATTIAALRGESLEDFITAALQVYLEREAPAASPQGWQSVFGQAR